MELQQYDPKVLLSIAFVAGMLIMAIVILIYNAIQGEPKTSIQVRSAQNELENYKAEMDAHFSSTASLMQNLADGYRDLYTHIANDAERLSSEEASAMDMGLLTRKSDDSEASDDQAPPEPEVKEGELEPLAQSSDSEADISEHQDSSDKG